MDNTDNTLVSDKYLSDFNIMVDSIPIKKESCNNNIDSIDDMISKRKFKITNLEALITSDEKRRWIASLGLLLTPSLMATSYNIIRGESASFREIVSSGNISNNICLLVTLAAPIISTIGTIYYNNGISEYKKEKAALENSVVFLQQVRENSNLDDLRRIKRVALLIEKFILNERYYRKLYKVGNYSLESKIISEGNRLKYTSDEINDNIDIVRTMIQEGFNYRKTEYDDLDEEIVDSKTMVKER